MRLLALLLPAFALACNGAVSFPDGVRPPANGNGGGGEDIANPSEAARAVTARVNEERRREGRDTLRTSAALVRAAELHARQMADARTLAHELPGARYPTLVSRVDATGYPWRAIAENIAQGYSSPGSVVNGWMLSAGHRDNILDRTYTETGVAVVTGGDGKAYWVQVFGAPR